MPASRQAAAVRSVPSGSVKWFVYPKLKKQQHFSQAGKIMFNCKESVWGRQYLLYFRSTIAVQKRVSAAEQGSCFSAQSKAA